MIVNLWSTPRTGSNWYSQYLFQTYRSENNKFRIYNQYLNQYNLKSYVKPNYKDFVYTYENNCYYNYYYYDHLLEAISYKPKTTKRDLDVFEEEKYRIKLLERHNFQKNPALFYSHVAPMSDLAYKKLFDMADKNVFLYRKNVKRQLSSYALAYGTLQYKPHPNQKTHTNVKVEYDVIKNLTDRIILWHNLDKTNCEVVCFEEIDFSAHNFSKKQNETDPYLQLDHTTQSIIVEMVDYFNASVQKNP